MVTKVAKWKWNLLSHVQLCNAMDYTVHGILQVRILEWVAFPFSRGSSQPRDQTQVSHIAGGFFTSWATGKPMTTGVGAYLFSRGSSWPRNQTKGSPALQVDSLPTEPKEHSNYHIITLISCSNQVMLQARLQKYVNWWFPEVQAGFRKGRGTIDWIVQH